MKVEVEISPNLLRKLKALQILEPMEGGIDDVIGEGLENWVDGKIASHLSPGLGRALPSGVRAEEGLEVRSDTARRSQRRPASQTRAYDPDPSGISSGLSDEVDEFEDDVDEARTSDPEAFIRPAGGLTEEAMDRDMRVSDPAHEAKMDASAIKEKKVTGSDSYTTPEELFAEHSGLPTPPPVQDARAARRKKQPTGKGKAFAFDGNEEHRI